MLARLRRLGLQARRPPGRSALREQRGTRRTQRFVTAGVSTVGAFQTTCANLRWRLRVPTSVVGWLVVRGAEKGGAPSSS